MAILNYWHLQAPVFPDKNIHLSLELEKYVGEQWWQPHESLISKTVASSVISNVPVGQNNKQRIKFVSTQNYFSDYYNRIHIAPSALALGNVASEQVNAVTVWNAYLIPKTFMSIDGLQEGISLSGQFETPLKFTGLQERLWNVSIKPDGPSSIDAVLTWNFGIDLPKLHITGTRIITFGWLVDWSKPVVENLQWLTDILQSQTGYEQRRSLRLSPRISYNVELLLYDTERQYFDLAMIGWGAKTFAIPVWPQQQWLKTAHAIGGLIIYCDTTNRNFRANRLAILRGQTAFDNETVEVESVLPDRLILKRPMQKAWGKGTCLSPAVTAQLDQQPQLSKRNDKIMRTSVSLNVTEPVDHPAQFPTSIYRGYPILEEKPNEQNDLTHSYERLLHSIENKTGFGLKTDLAKAAFGLYQYDWMTYGRKQQAALRSLFYALRGSQKAIWLPTFSADLTVKAVISANSKTIDIVWCGYSRFAQGQTGRQDIQITLRNRSVLYRRIIASAEINTTTERLELDQAFVNQINIADVINISFISLCRLSNDNLSIEHINDSDGIAKASATFRGIRQE